MMIKNIACVTILIVIFMKNFTSLDRINDWFINNILSYNLICQIIGGLTFLDLVSLKNELKRLTNVQI